MKPSRAERKLLLQRRLQKAKTDSQALSEAAAFYGALIATLIDEEPTVELPALDAASLEAKLLSGQPLLYGESLGFDVDAVRALLLKLCAVTEQFGAEAARQETGPNRGFRWPRARQADDAALRERVAAVNVAASRGLAAAQIRRALETGALDFDALLDHLLQGHDDELLALAAKTQLDANLLITLARFALRPTLSAFADAFADPIRARADQWMRGTCPVCGGPPVLSEYRDAGQSRHLRCAACGESWLFRRLECSHCGTSQFRALSYLKLTDDAAHQVDTCDECRHYIKGIAASETVPSDLLPLEDLLTLHLDVAAQQQGYQRT